MASDKTLKNWQENEAPVIFWILAVLFTIVIGFILGSVLTIAVKFLPLGEEGNFFAPFEDFVSTMASFSGFFLSFVFALKHICKTSLRAFLFGADLIFGASSYFIGAFFLYISNLLIGGMETGLVFHFLNNFFVFFVIRNKILALTTPTIFIDNTVSSAGTSSFISEVIIYILPLIYLIWVKRRRKP